MNLARHGWLWVAAGSLLLGGCGGPRVVGWPGHYFNDAGTGSAYVAVIIGVIATIGFLVARYNLYRAEDWDYELDASEAEGVANFFLVLSGGSFLGTIIVLQFLPEVPSGIAIVPSAPWNYETTAGASLAWIAWIFFGFYVLILLAALGSESEEGAELAKGAMGNLIIAGFFTLCASFCTVATPIGTPPPDPHVAIAQLPEEFSGIDPAVLAKIPTEHLERLKKMRSEMEGFGRTTQRFRADKEKIVGQLKGLGVTSATKLEPNTKAADLVDELKELAGQLKLLERKLEAYELAVTRQVSVVRRIGRQMELKELAGVTEMDLAELDVAKVELDTKLEEVGKSTAVSAVELDELLKQELGQ